MFTNAHLKGRSTFVGTIFRDKALFGEVKFGKLADFSTLGSFIDSPGPTGSRYLRLGKADDFSNAFRYITFRSAKFHGPIAFNNRRFLNSADFSGCVFLQAPDFHNCVLHQDTIFEEAHFEDTTSLGAARTYRTLKLAMENARARQEEAMFFALEQKSLRIRKDTPASVWLLSKLYEIVASYGQSFVRPILLLLTNPLLFFLIYFAMLTGPMVGINDFKTIIRITLQQIFRPFELFSIRATPEAVFIDTYFAGLTIDPSEVPLLRVAAVGAVQSLLTFVLLALFLFALRRRFKTE